MSVCVQDEQRLNLSTKLGIACFEPPGHIRIHRLSGDLRAHRVGGNATAVSGDNILNRPIQALRPRP